jgi:DUF4097 and DUF4098 domain-containing protein YvlB
MKNTIIPLLMGTGMFCLQLPLIAQSFKEHISKEYTLSEDAAGQTLFIYNINGFIKVEGYAGTKVMMEVDETISADDNLTLEAGKKEFRLGFDQKTDSIIAYIAEPFDSRPRQRWNYDHREINYRYQADYTVKVPNTMNLHISTVNNGLINVSNVSGVLNINNVNGKITITNAKGTTNARTVNGDIAINYLVNPPEQSSYHTINGNIDIRYQQDLSADLQFKSMHGDFFTDFPETEILPASSTKNQENKNGQTIYKINKTPLVRFGKGGKVFKFETLNGNVYIRKQS